MTLAQQIQDLPRALRENLEKNRPEYEALIRRTTWGDGPVFLLGDESSFALGISASCAFEDLVGWPGILRDGSEFLAYSLPALRPGSVVMVMELSGHSAELLEAAEAAKRRRARVLAVTDRPSGELAKMADGTFTVRTPDERAGERAPAESAVCAHTCVNFIAWLAARLLKRPRPEIDAQESEFAALPEHVEWMLGQLRDAARSLGAAVEGAGNVYVTGGGQYRAIATEWVRSRLRLNRTPAQFVAPWEFREVARLPAGTTLVCISGSRCKVKKQVHELARAMKIAGAKVLSVTDRNDRELAERSDLAVLLPVLGEATGSILTLALLEWSMAESGRQKRETRT